MTRSCPLPVDWLDYLDGEGEPELAEHLAGCRSCQALVASLQAHAPATVPSDWTDEFVGRTDAVWHEDRPAKPAPAEFWFSAADFELDELFVAPAKHSKRFSYRDVDRVLVLVLSHPDEDHIGWVDIVPVLSDVESATETDLLFSADENTLGAPWRALFAHQLKVARRQLDTRVGSLSELATRVLTAALAGDFDDRRWGVALEHPDDPRARLDEHLDEALRRLRTPWLLLHDADELDERRGEDNPGLEFPANEPDRWGRPRDEIAHRDLAHRNLYWLAPVSEAVHEYALAAASSPRTSGSLWAVDREGVTLVGTLAVDFPRGLLTFVITAATLQHARRVRMHVVAAGTQYTSEPFVPAEHTTVPLAKDVTAAEVERLGAEVVA